MLLLEIFTDIKIQDDHSDDIDDDKHSRYDPSADRTVMKRDHTRNTRLTLKQINAIRTMQELRASERLNDEKSYQAQYAPAPAEVPQI